MDRDKAVQLLRSGAKGVSEWNEWRRDPNNHPPPSLEGADLSGCELFGVHLHQVNLRGANLSEARLKRAFLAHSDLTNANLELAFLEDANLISAKLDYANMRHAWAPGASFAEASLCAADLRDGYFRLVDLSGADLERVNAQSINLTGAILRSTTLSGGDLTGARFESTALCDTDMSGVHGLETVTHDAQSFIDGGTLRKSKGIPDLFLRGCGLADWEIEAAKLHRSSLELAQVVEIIQRIKELRMTRPVRVGSCFISYSHKDQAFVQTLYEALQVRGVRCWLDERDVLPGERLHDVVDRAIQTHDRLLLCCSQHSLTSSWVDDEIAAATERERKEGRDILIPLNLDDYLFDGWKSGRAPRIRERLAADFRLWSDAAKFDYQVGRLLLAMRQERQG